jgi:hypothetical protein
LTIEQRIDANGLPDAGSPRQQDRKSQLACVVLAFDDVDTAVETIAGKIHPIVVDSSLFGIHVELLIAASRIPVLRSADVSVHEIRLMSDATRLNCEMSATNAITILAGK